MEETPRPQTNVRWEPDARRSLEGETIYLRERLRNRAEQLARDTHQPVVDLELLENVRRTPSRMASRRIPTSPPHRPSWPVLAGAYRLGDPSGTVAICTLAADGLVEPLASSVSPGVAIVGRAFTENLGVEKLVTNVVSNPRIRTLVLCGTESRHLVGQALLCLHQNGLDTRNRVIGSEGPQPILASLPATAIGIFQQKLEIVDLREQTDPGAILDRARQAAAPRPSPWSQAWEPRVPTTDLLGDSTGSRPSRFSPDPSGFFLIGLGPARETVEMEHYTRQGTLDARLVGRSAVDLCGAVQDHGLVQDSGHAMYLGSELQKAEMAVALGVDYEQDRPLEIQSSVLE